jgi:hypothetical protein
VLEFTGISKGNLPGSGGGGGGTSRSAPASGASKARSTNTAALGGGSSKAAGSTGWLPGAAGWAPWNDVLLGNYTPIKVSQAACHHVWCWWISTSRCCTMCVNVTVRKDHADAPVFAYTSVTA